MPAPQHSTPKTRASSNQSNIDEVVRCPYDKYHWISRSRLQIHLAKCSQDKKLHICILNYTHHFKTEEALNNHLKECEDRCKMDRGIYREPSSISANTSMNGSFTTERNAQNISNLSSPAVEQEEDWDSCNYETYDPKEATKHVALIMNPKTVLSKSGRKKFRAQQRINFSRNSSVYSSIVELNDNEHRNKEKQREGKHNK